MGPRALTDPDEVERLVEGLLALMNGEAVCQQGDDRDKDESKDDNDADNDDENDDDDERRFDTVLTDSVSDALCAVAKACGSSFGPLLDEVVLAALKRCKTSMPIPDRITALGVFFV